MRYMIGDDLSKNFFHLLKKTKKKKKKKKINNKHCSV